MSETIPETPVTREEFDELRRELRRNARQNGYGADPGRPIGSAELQAALRNLLDEARDEAEALVRRARREGVLSEADCQAVAARVIAGLEEFVTAEADEGDDEGGARSLREFEQGKRRAAPGAKAAAKARAAEEGQRQETPAPSLAKRLGW